MMTHIYNPIHSGCWGRRIGSMWVWTTQCNNVLNNNKNISNTKKWTLKKYSCDYLPKTFVLCHHPFFPLISYSLSSFSCKSKWQYSKYLHRTCFILNTVSNRLHASGPLSLHTGLDFSHSLTSILDLKNWGFRWFLSLF